MALYHLWDMNNMRLVMKYETGTMRLIEIWDNDLSDISSMRPAVWDLVKNEIGNYETKHCMAQWMLKKTRVEALIIFVIYCL